MDKKYCDNCEKEINNTKEWYEISVFKHEPFDKNGEEHDLGISEYCKDCFKVILKR